MHKPIMILEERCVRWAGVAMKVERTTSQVEPEGAEMLISDEARED